MEPDPYWEYEFGSTKLLNTDPDPTWIRVHNTGQNMCYPYSQCFVSADLDPGPRTKKIVKKFAMNSFYCKSHAAGFDIEEVCERELPKSIGCSKNFRGPDMLDTRTKVICSECTGSLIL